MSHTCNPQNSDWNRRWHIVDSVHDGSKQTKTQMPDIPPITSYRLFTEALNSLYRAPKQNNPYQSCPGTLGTHYFIIKAGNATRGVEQTLNRYGKVNGIMDNNPRPTEFGLTNVCTISQYFDPAAKRYDFARCKGFGRGNLFTKDLRNCGLPGWQFEATKKPSSITFNVRQVGNNYEITVDKDGYVIDCNNNDTLVNNYISGNYEKNSWIYNNNSNNLQTILPRAMGYVLCKMLGDYSHVWFCDDADVICTSDTYLIKRCIKERKGCVCRTLTKSGQEFRFYPNTTDFLSKPLRGGAIPGSLTFQDKLTKLKDSISFFTYFYDIILSINMRCRTPTGFTRSGFPYQYNYEWNVTLEVEDEYLIDNKLDWNTTFWFSVVFLIFVGGGAYITLTGGSITNKENNPWEIEDDENLKYNNNNLSDEFFSINVEQLLNEYDNLLENLQKFLTNNKKDKIKINERLYDSTQSINDYINSIINSVGNKIKETGESSLENIIKTKLVKYKENYTSFCDEYFKWVPTNIFFHTDYMNTIVNTNENKYYTPLKVNKFFPYLDDSVVKETFGIENNFNKETFYHFITQELGIDEINESSEVSIVIKDTYEFKTLLTFLESKYSNFMPLEKNGEKNTTLNTKYDNTNFLEQINYFKNNGVSIENSRVFMRLLSDTTIRNVIPNNDIMLEILREIGNTEPVTGYTLYNKCYPYLFISGKYIFNYDVFSQYINFLQNINQNENENISIYKKFIDVDFMFDLKETKYTLECIFDEPSIKNFTSIESLFTYYKEHQNEIDLKLINEINDYIKILPFQFIQKNIKEFDNFLEKVTSLEINSEMQNVKSPQLYSKNMDDSYNKSKLSDNSSLSSLSISSSGGKKNKTLKNKKKIKKNFSKKKRSKQKLYSKNRITFKSKKLKHSSVKIKTKARNN
jgi:hypothetical protein